MELRDAAEHDLAGLVAIYNDVIATSTAVYSSVPVALEDRRQWWRARVEAGYPVLVAPLDLTENSLRSVVAGVNLVQPIARLP